MIRRIATSSLALVVVAGSALAQQQAAEPAAQTTAAELYQHHCASCHGTNRLGGTGPALIPDTLGRMHGPQIAKVVAEGRPATQMPAFAASLSATEITALADHLKTPLAVVPTWSADDIAASRISVKDYTPAAAPVFKADPLNLFVVVETGDHHISVLDGDTFERLDRFATPFAVHGGPKFSPDGRFVFVMSRDGWVQKYDLWSLKEVGRVRAGLNARNIAISRDGKWLAVANYLPRTLTILSTADLTLARVLDVADKNGTPSRVSAVYQAPARDSFILALKDVAEIWEIATGADASPVREGFATIEDDHKSQGSAGSQSMFVRRRIAVSQPIDDFFFDPPYRHLVGAARDGGKAVVVDLTAGGAVAELPLPGMPHLGSGISWMRDGRRVMATPHLKEGKLSVIGIDDWKLVTTIKTAGAGFFLRSHEDTPYVWADAFLSPSKDKIHLIDKQSLEIVKTLQPVPGATAAHTEFDRHGRHALVSIWEDPGWLIVYDARTLGEVRRIPMRKPSGKYNVWNKITFSEGTSH